MPDPIKAPFHFEITYNERPANYSMRTIAICKTHYEIVYIISGDRKFITSSGEYHAHAGDISTTPINMYYHGSSLSHTTYKNIVIKFHKEMATPFIQIVGELAFTSIFDAWIHHFTSKAQKKIKHIIYNMLDEYNHYDELSELVLQGMLHNLLSIIMRERLLDTHTNILSHKTNPLILKALYFMEQSYLENPSLKETAAHVSLSPEYFSRLFKEVVGASFSDYLNKIRLRHAYQLLEQTNLSIGEVAEQSGFSNGNYMCDVMKRYLGMSPTAYRKLALHKTP